MGALGQKKATEGPESRVRRELPIHSSCIKERLDCARFMKTWADICLPQSNLIPTLGPYFSPRKMVGKTSTFILQECPRMFSNVLEWPSEAVSESTSLRLLLELCPSWTIELWNILSSIVHFLSALRTKYTFVHTTMDENCSCFMWWGSWTQALILHSSEEVIAGKFWSRMDCLAAPPRALDCPTVIILALKCTHQCTPPPLSNASKFNEYRSVAMNPFIWAKLLKVPALTVLRPVNAKRHWQS